MNAPVRSDRLQHLLALILAVWFAFLAIAYHQRFPPGTLPGHGMRILVALLILASAAGLGAPLVRKLAGPGTQPLMHGLIAVGLGLGALELSMLALTAAGIASPIVAWLLVAAGLVAGGRRLAARLDASLGTVPEAFAALRDEARARWWALPILALACAGWLAALGAALAPAEFYDALIYHLAVPDRYLASGGIGAVPGNFYSHFPANQGMLYALGMLLSSERVEAGTLAQLLHLLLGLLSVVVTLLIGRRHLSPGVGLLGAGLLATVPGILLSATWPIADLAVTFDGALVLALLLDARAEDGRARRGRLLLAGLMAGLALGVKYTAVPSVLLPALVWLAWEARRLDASRLKELATFTAAAALVFAPWTVRNLAVTGNPVAPYMSSIFGGPEGGIGLSEEVTRRLPEGASFGALAVHYLSAPWRAGLERLGAGGHLGAALTLLIPFVFLGRGRSAALAPIALLGATAVLAWAASSQVTRYLFPALPALCLLAAHGGASLVRAAPPLRAPLAAGLGWLLLHNVYLFGVLALTVNPYGVAFGVEMPEDYLSRRVSYYPAASFINAQLPEGARLLLVGEARGYYIERAYDASTPYDPILLGRLAGDAVRERADLGSVLRRAGYTHMLVSRPEMERVARMQGRGGYFDALDEAARASVAGLFRDGATRTLFERNGVSVLEILGGQGSAPFGASSPASCVSVVDV